jgi:hypothetical protein
MMDPPNSEPPFLLFPAEAPLSEMVSVIFHYTTIQHSAGETSANEEMVKGSGFKIRRKKQHGGTYKRKEGEKTNKFEKGQKNRPKN